MFGASTSKPLETSDRDRDLHVISETCFILGATSSNYDFSLFYQEF